MPILRELVRRRGTAPVCSRRPVSGSTSAGVAAPSTDVHHAGQTDLRSDPLQHQHVAVARGDDMTIPLAAHDEADHLAADVATPPSAFEGAVGAAQGVDHRRDLGMRLAEHVEDALCGQVAGDLLPHDVAQFELRDVRPDAQRGRESPSRCSRSAIDQHAVDGDLDPDDVVDARRPVRTRHAHPRIRPPSAPLTLSSVSS